MRWEWSAWRPAWPPLWESWSQPQNSSHRWPPAWVWVSEWVGACPGRATCLLRFHGHWLHLLFPSVGCDPTCHESTSCYFEILFMHIYLLVPAELVSMLFYENYIFLSVSWGACCDTSVHHLTQNIFYLFDCIIVLEVCLVQVQPR